MYSIIHFCFTFALKTDMISQKYLVESHSRLLSDRGLRLNELLSSRILKCTIRIEKGKKNHTNRHQLIIF